ncbi:ABC-2 type transporter [human gut metagenome]|uniref:ABC-2 type transporter n=1 Tax=human gut metagenome TaxID=408170 RepID=K1UFZ1_9ZZZZ
MAETMQVSAQRAWTHLKKYQPLIHELVSRDLKVKYRRSFLGYIWSILNPLLMMLLQSIIFSYMFRNDIPKLPALPDLRQHPVYLFQ